MWFLYILHIVITLWLLTCPQDITTWSRCSLDCIHTGKSWKLPFSFCSSPELFWSCTICWSVHLYHTIEMFNFSPEPSFSTKLDAIDFWIKDTACIQVFFSDKVKFRDEKNTLWKWAFVWENLLNYKFYTRSAMWYLGTEKHLCIT